MMKRISIVWQSISITARYGYMLLMLVTVLFSLMMGITLAWQAGLFAFCFISIWWIVWLAVHLIVSEDMIEEKL